MTKQTFAERLLALGPQGRTLEELSKELGVPVAELKQSLENPRLPSGAELHSWLSDLGVRNYQILPPEPPAKPLKPRAFRFAVNQAESYLRIFLPDDIRDASGRPAKCVEIRPFSDVHWGHQHCDKKNFLLDVKEVERRPNRFTFLNGDILENALGDSAGGEAWSEQSATPRKQREQLQVIFDRIRDKTFFGLPGNHELRTRKKTLQDPLREIARSLGIPYFDGPVNMEIIWKGYRWTFYATHGTGASNTIGGKLTAAGKARYFSDFRNFHIMGHVHDEVVHRAIRKVRRREFEDGKLKRFWVEYLKEYKIICPSYLLYTGTYAEEAGYSPGSRNNVTLQLFANGDYHVVSSKRREDGEHEEVETP